MAADAKVKQALSWAELEVPDQHQQVYLLVRRAHLVAALVEAEPGDDAAILREAVSAISDALEKALKILETERKRVGAPAHLSTDRASGPPGASCSAPQ